MKPLKASDAMDKQTDTDWTGAEVEAEAKAEEVPDIEQAEAKAEEVPDIEQTEAGDFSDTERKLRALAELYMTAAALVRLPENVKKLHRSMFGLTLYDEESGAHSAIYSRSGLILTEKILDLLCRNVEADRLRSYLRGLPKKGPLWADTAFAEWQRPAGRTPTGAWWPQVVLPEATRSRISTLNIVVGGLEMMGLVERTKVLPENRPHPRSRGLVIRATAAGRDFFELLKR